MEIPREWNTPSGKVERVHYTERDPIQYTKSNRYLSIEFSLSLCCEIPRVRVRVILTKISIRETVERIRTFAYEIDFPRARFNCELRSRRAKGIDDLAFQKRKLYIVFFFVYSFLSDILNLLLKYR